MYVYIIVCKLPMFRRVGNSAEDLKEVDGANLLEISAPPKQQYLSFWVEGFSFSCMHVCIFIAVKWRRQPKFLVHPFPLSCKQCLAPIAFGTSPYLIYGNGGPWEETAAWNRLNVHFRPLTYQDSHYFHKSFCVHSCMIMYAYPSF